MVFPLDVQIFVNGSAEITLLRADGSGNVFAALPETHAFQ